MALKNRKIRKKHRGTRTNGRGKKGSRQKGHAGGRGNAGSFRHKKIWFIKNKPEYFGKHGMPPGKKEKIRYITLDWVEEYAERKGIKEIDVTEFGYSRVTGRGNISKPLVIKANTFTKRAVEKIESAGGKAITI